MLICSIPGCEKPSDRKGWCTGHYYRWHRHGDPVGGSTPKGAARRFLENAFGYEGDECTLWPFSKAGRGYGNLTINGRNYYAHRLVCEATHGPAPAIEYEAAHLCGNGHRGCITPKHLVWKTPVENNADKIAHGTDLRGEKAYNSKLSTADVLAIRVSTDRGVDLAKRYGVAPSHICYIRKGAKWGWLLPAEHTGDRRNG